MPARLVLCPVVVQNGVRKPKVATIVDPGKLPDETGELAMLVHSSIISDGIGRAGQRDDICLSLVAGVDLSNLDADSEIVSLFEIVDSTLGNIQAVLGRSPAEIGWNRGTVNRLRTRLRDRQADDSDLTESTPLYGWANRLAAQIAPGDVRALKTSRAGA